MIELYHYIHCPYCVRVRMAFGYFNLPYKSIPLPYEDEETPNRLCQAKMLPIIKDDSGNAMNESLDIIKKFLPEDKADFFNYPEEELKEYNTYLSGLGKNIHPLAMPYWIYTKEFSEKSREYFQTKKEKSKGPFAEMFRNRYTFLERINIQLSEIEKKIPNNDNFPRVNIKDIMLASHLWGLYIVPEFQFSNKIHSYLQNIKQQCKFEYHKDFWE